MTDDNAPLHQKLSRVTALSLICLICGVFANSGVAWATNPVDFADSAIVDDEPLPEHPRLPDGPSEDLSKLWLTPEMVLKLDLPKKGDEAALYAWIKNELSQVPADTRDVPSSGQELERVKIVVDRARVGCYRYLSEQPKGPHRLEVQIELIKIESLNVERFLYQRNQEAKEIYGENPDLSEQIEMLFSYFRPVLQMSYEGFKLNPSPKQRAELLTSIGETYLLMSGRFFGLRTKSSIQDGRALLKGAVELFKAALAIPECPDAPNITIKYINAALDGGMHRISINASKEFLKKWPKHRYAGHLFFFWHRALRHSGHINEALALWKRFDPVLEAGATGKVMPEWYVKGKWIPAEREQKVFELFNDRKLFYQAFFTWANGDSEKAQKLLEQFTEYCNNKADHQGGISPSTKVYRDSMAFFLLNTLQGFKDNAPAIELGERGWLSPPATHPRKVHLVVFCATKRASQRYRDLFRLLADTYTNWANKGLHISWIAPSSLRKADTNEKQKLDLANAVTELGVNFNVGIDLRPDIPLWHSYGLNRGSVQLFIIDENNRVRWQLIDPLGKDIALIRAVLRKYIKK